MSVSIGFFNPRFEIGPRLDEICQRIREICGEPAAGFCFRASPVENEKGGWPMLYAYVSGHVPIHIDRLAAHQSSQAMFMFVLEAEDRPVLLCTPASRDTAQSIFVPEEVKAPRAMFGAIELAAGKAVHIDPTAQFHGITAYPTGDMKPTVPSCIMVQVPHGDAKDIAGAIATMKRCFRSDERFADLVTKKGTG